MRAHPYADRFPMLDTDELNRLADDIRENGLRNPIVLDGEGRILDGRNRWAACEIADVTPVTVAFDGDDEAAYVLSANGARRHQSVGSLAMSTALVLADDGKRDSGRWKRGSVANPDSGIIPGKTWQNQMNMAGVILDHASDLADSVVDGDLALDAAHKEAEKNRDEARSLLEEQERIEAEEAAYREHLDQVAPEYLETYKTARQAYAAWEDDNREAAAKERRAKAARETADAKRRDALTKTYSKMFETFMSAGSYTGSIDRVMADFHPSLLSPPSLARYGEEGHIRKAITFLTDYLEWKQNNA